MTKKSIGSRELLEKASQNNTKFAIFNAIRKHGKIKTSDMETKVQASRPTLLKYLEELVKEKLIVESEQAEYTVGRPPKLYSVNASVAYALGIDFGTSGLTFAIIGLAKNIIDKRQIHVTLRESPMEVIKKMIDGMRDIADANSISLEEQILAVGIGVPCWLDVRSELTLPVPQLPHWEGIPLRTIIERDMPFRAFVRIGPRLMVLGERTFGGDNVSNMFYISIQQSIGMGVYVEGILLRGSKWGASKLGHTIVLPDGPKCVCGRRGCLEALASEPAILRKARELMGVEITMQELFDAIYDGNAKAQRVMNDALGYLAIALVNAIEFFDPELVVLGGSLAQGGDFVIQCLSEKMHELGLDLADRRIKLRMSELAPYTGALGAADLALEKACWMPTG
jgi:predicted NBD/HSP70 family sugar kinase